MNTKVDVRLDRDTKNKLQKSADKAGLSLSTFIRLILQTYKDSSVAVSLK